MAFNESRVVLEHLAHSCQKERYGQHLTFQKFRSGSEPLFLRGYDRTGHAGNFGKTTDAFLILSKKYCSPVDWFNPATDTVDFFVLLDTDVPHSHWKWTLLHHLGGGDFIETVLSIGYTPV